MITWPYSNKVCLLLPSICRSLVGKFLGITSTRNKGSAVNFFPLEDFFPLSPKDNDSLKQLCNFEVGSGKGVKKPKEMKLRNKWALSSITTTYFLF
jgi:hypothetical protein